MTPEQTNNLIQWLNTTAASIAFGSVIIEVVRHDNQTRHIIKTITQKIKVDAE